jgi:predicted site-specific integrase-resolvase
LRSLRPWRPRLTFELVKTMEIIASSHTRSRAAEYVRMSTEHQQYSPENQLDIIRQYAADHNMEIVQVYSDHGRSGLNIAGRDG